MMSRSEVNGVSLFAWSGLDVVMSSLPPLSDTRSPAPDEGINRPGGHPKLDPLPLETVSTLYPSHPLLYASRSIPALPPPPSTAAAAQVLAAVTVASSPSAMSTTSSLPPSGIRRSSKNRGLAVQVSMLGDDRSPSPLVDSPISDSNESSSQVPRLPPILQVEKLKVTTTATQAASAQRRTSEALFSCPVPGCGSSFTRKFNLKGHMRSHTKETPFECGIGDCDKKFARQHDCKRHQAVHASKAKGLHTCQGCRKSFSRADALSRHLRSENGSGCRRMLAKVEIARGPSLSASETAS
ncbi:hypothetical protein FRC03_010537 [Tulasnella sp. 419]|nr:hypothetical protein FRC03_010537 [Tulasnella sp. 419]